MNINDVRPNQKGTCLSVSTKHGYRIISLENLKTLSDQILSAPVQIAQMYYNTNILLLVTANKPNIIQFFDDSLRTPKDTFRLPHAVQRILVRKKILFVHTVDHRLHILDLFTLETKTVINDIRGFGEFHLDVPLNNSDMVGWNAPEDGRLKIAAPLDSQPRTVGLHNKRIRLFCFNPEGSMVASLAKGTLVKVTDLLTGMQRKFWLNYSDVEISHLVYSRSSDYIAVAEKGGLVKLLSLVGSEGEDIGRKSYFKAVLKEGVFMKVGGCVEGGKVVFGARDEDLFIFNHELNQVMRIEINYDKKVASIMDTKLIIPKS